MAQVTTARILADRALQSLSSEACVDWAVGLLLGGHDGEAVAMLAGMSPPFNAFETADLCDRALAEVGAPDLAEDEAVHIFAAERLRAALSGDADMGETLGVVRDFCVAHDYDRALYDFYLLCFAREDLVDEQFSAHWPSATRASIDALIRQRAAAFVAEVAVRYRTTASRSAPAEPSAGRTK